MYVCIIYLSYVKYTDNHGEEAPDVPYDGTGIMHSGQSRDEGYIGKGLFYCQRNSYIDIFINIITDVDVQTYGGGNKVKRKRKANPSTWKNVINKSKRMNGEAYAGFTHIKIGQKVKQERNVPKPTGEGVYFRSMCQIKIKTL